MPDCDRGRRIQHLASMLGVKYHLVLKCCCKATSGICCVTGRSWGPYLKSALCQKLCSTPACLLSYGLTLPLLWLMSVTVSDRAACDLLSMSGSDKCALTRCPSKAAAALHNSRRVQNGQQLALLHSPRWP
jgi:hypothetical protein